MTCCLHAFASDALVRCYPVASDMESSVSRLHVASHFNIELSRPTVAPICRSVMSLIARINPWIVQLTRSMLPWELVSDGTILVDTGWDVRASFVVDVNDAWFLGDVECHFLMTSGQHVGCEYTLSAQPWLVPFQGTKLAKNALVTPR